MGEFFYSIVLSIFLVIITTVIFYEILRFVWQWLPHLKIAERQRLIIVMLSIFTGHTMAVLIYGIVYWFLVTHLQFGHLSGEYNDGTFFTYLYFSAATYSSLGLGDVFPLKGLRLLTGVEVLNGLVLIGWSVSFIYLAMEKFWDMPKHHKYSNKK